MKEANNNLLNLINNFETNCNILDSRLGRKYCSHKQLGGKPSKEKLYVFAMIVVKNKSNDVCLFKQFCNELIGFGWNLFIV